MRSMSRWMDKYIVVAVCWSCRLLIVKKNTHVFTNSATGIYQLNHFSPAPFHARITDLTYCLCRERSWEFQFVYYIQRFPTILQFLEGSGAGRWWWGGRLHDCVQYACKYLQKETDQDVTTTTSTKTSSASVVFATLSSNMPLQLKVSTSLRFSCGHFGSQLQSCSWC